MRQLIIAIGIIIFFSGLYNLNGQSSIIISQYIETNSGSTPKGIEILNVSGTDIVFSPSNNLQIFQGTNGGSCTALSSTNVTSGTLAANEVWVIGTSDLTTYATNNGANLSGTTTYAFDFNGDDALQLRLGGVIQDVFGTCGSDPGTSWSGSGVSTANENIAIISGTCTGDTDGWTDPSTRFVGISVGSTMTDFGSIDYSCNSCTPPTNQASSFSTSNIQTAQMDVNWTRGNGANVLVIARQGSAVSSDPSNGVTYTANATFSSGSAIGSGYVVYNGTGTSVTVSGLSPSTVYHYAVYEFDGSSGSECYRTTNKLTGNASTQPPPTIIVSPTTRTGFSYTQGAGPSASQTYTLSASNLSPADGNLSVTGSTNYEVSSDNNTFSGSLNVAYSGGALANTTLYVRLKAGLTAGNYNSETIANSGGSATTQNVTCSGTVIPPPQYYRTKQAGNWSDVSTWETSSDNVNWVNATVTPADNDLSLTIQGHAIIVSSSVTVDQLTINNGGQLTVNSGVTLTLANGVGTDLIIDGLLTNNGSLTLQGVTSTVVNGTLTNTGVLTMNTANTSLTINGVFTQSGSGAVTNNNNGPISFSSGSTYNHSRNGGVVPTATWDAASLCNVTGVTATEPTGLGQVFGQFTWNCTGQTANLSPNMAGFGATGLFTMSSTNSNFINMNSGSSALVFNIYGVIVSGGSRLSLNNGTNTTTVNIGLGGITVTGSGSRVEFAAGSGNVAGFYRTTVNLSGNITFGANTTIAASSSDDYGLINLVGGAQNYSAGITTSRIDYVIETGATLTLLSNFSIRSSSGTNYDQIEVNGVLNVGTYTITQTGSNQALLALNANSLLITNNTGGLASSISSTFSGNVLFDGAASYQFDAATTTPFFTDQSASVLAQNVTLGAAIELNTNLLTISGELNLAGGKLTLGSKNLVIAAAATITGYSAAGYVITNGSGRLKRNGVGSTAREFPIGDGTYYTPVTIANAGTTDNFSIAFSAVTGACFVPENSVAGNWDILEDTPGNSNCTISIDYGSVPAGGSFVANEAVIGHCTGANLDYYSGTSVSGTLVTGSGFTAFSPFGITKSSALPIELLSFEVSKLTETAALINWSTALEINNDYMAVERSADGIAFSEIGRIKGTNSDAPRAYRLVDERPLNGRNYYRLRQVDFDGKTTWHRVATLDFQFEAAGLSLYPSPVVEWMRVARPQGANGTLAAQVLDMQGRILWQNNWPAEEQTLEVSTSDLPAGLYHLRLVGSGSTWTERFVKQ